jgi:hypothetical protein
MQALIVSLLIAAASPALAQAPAPSKDALALGGRIAHAAQPQIERGLHNIIDGLAANYRNDVAKTGLAVDERSLEDVGRSEFDAALPLLWDGMAKVYAQTYTLDELKTLEVYYRLHPGDSTKLPAALAAKNLERQQHEQELVAQLGPRIMQDFFGDYCSRSTCSDSIRRAAGLPLRGGD